MSLIPKACFFTGHRIIRDDKKLLVSFLREEILNKINDDVTVFIAGGALGFDTIAAEQVIDMKKDYDAVRLCLYLPCINQDADWCEADRIRFGKIKELADEVYYVTKKGYTDGCMKKRNRAMVEGADCGIAYLTNGFSGTAQTVKLAEEKGIEVINIAAKINV